MAGLLPDIPNISPPPINFDPFGNSTFNISNITLPCDFSVDVGGELFSLILSISLIVMGLFFLLVGSRYFKSTLFGFSFVFGAGLGFYVVSLVSDCNTQVGLIVAVIMGIIIGSLTVKLWKVALFVMGAGVGFVLWTTFKALAAHLLSTDYIMYGSLAAACLGLGLIALKMEKLWLLVGTPIVGAFLCTQGVDNFVDHDLNVFKILNTVQGTGAGCALTVCYVLYSCVLGLSLIGIFIQYRYTSEFAEERREREAEEEDYEEETRAHKKKKKKGKKKKKRSRSRSRDRKRRRRRRRKRRHSYSSSG